MGGRTVRVAAVQAAPVFLDLGGSVEKAVRLVGEAAARGARLAAFGETWLPGYPAWLDLCPGAAVWDHPPAKKAYARLLENSVAIPGPETERLAEAARAHGTVVVIGVHERVPAGPGHGTLYNTQIVFGADGAILSRHRKLVPTHAERLVWGQGDGGGLAAVPTAVGQLIAARDLPPGLELPADLKGKPDALLYDGGSCIIAPDGSILAGPVLGKEEILVADLDLGRIAEESMALDVTGHYNRPDLFDLRLRG